MTDSLEMAFCSMLKTFQNFFFFFPQQQSGNKQHVKEKSGKWRKTNPEIERNIDLKELV